jgi:pilus assembly protein CpaE
LSEYLEENGMPNRNKTVKLEINNVQIRDHIAAVISSMEGFLVQRSDDPLPPDLLILEMGDDPARDFEHLKRVKDAGGAREFFLTSKTVSPDVLIQALRLGVKEFISQPVNDADVRAALSKILDGIVPLSTTTDGPQRKGQIINIFGGKGGVGTTTIAVNLADNMARLEPSPAVALIDMNRLFGEIPLFLGMDCQFNWVDVSKNIARLDATYLQSILYRHRSGLRVLPSPDRVDDEFTVTPQIIETLLRFMRTMFDFVIIDSGQSVDDISKMILRLSDKVLLVSVLSLPCLVNVKKILNTYRNLGYPPEPSVEVVVNRYERKSIVSLKEAEESIGKKPFWVVPNDYQLSMNAVNQGKPLSLVEGSAEITMAIRNMAAAVAGRRQGHVKHDVKRKEKRAFWG